MVSGAIQTIEVISAKKEDREMYDQRSKAQRDYEWGLASAREEGREEGRHEGRLIGRIQTIQEILGDSVSSSEELEQLTTVELTKLLEQLQVRMRSRQA
jgi:flagellar biosynthesis/type III secretory pathway protein FliH